LVCMDSGSRGWGSWLFRRTCCEGYLLPCLLPSIPRRHLPHCAAGMDEDGGEGVGAGRCTATLSSRRPGPFYLFPRGKGPAHFPPCSTPLPSKPTRILGPSQLPSSKRAALRPSCLRTVRFPHPSPEVPSACVFTFLVRSHPNPPAFSARRNCLPQNARPSGRLVSGQFGFLTHRPRCRARVCSPSWFAEVGGCSGEGGCHQPQRLGSDHASSARLSTQDEDQGRASRSIPIRPLFTGALSKCPLRMILRASGKLGVPACAPMAHGSGKDTVGIGGPL